ncbi:MAG: hypothetical protein J7J02_08445 [Sulfurovum sp.]|nr:hypothetical protein [Sulfurovum sp.]
MKIKSMLLSFVVLGVSLYANQPSFDCAKVKKKSSEGIICSSDELMDQRS